MITEGAIKGVCHRVTRKLGLSETLLHTYWDVIKDPEPNCFAPIRIAGAFSVHCGAIGAKVPTSLRWMPRWIAAFQEGFEDRFNLFVQLPTAAKGEINVT